MITTFQMYLVTIATNICNLLAFIGFISLLSIAILVICFGFFMDKRAHQMKNDGKIDEVSAKLLKYLKLSVFVFVVAVLLRTFMPNTKEICAIYVIPKIMNNEQVQECTENMLKSVSQWCLENFPDKNQQIDVK